MNDLKRESNGHGILIAFSLFLALYLFVPFLFVVPLELLDQSAVLSGRLTAFNRYFFLPLTTLDAHCPPYHSLIQAEGDIVGKLLSKVFP